MASAVRAMLLIVKLFANQAPRLHGAPTTGNTREIGGPRPSRTAPARTLVVLVDDFVNAARDLALIRSSQGSRVHFFRIFGRINRESALWRRAHVRIGGKAERVVIGD